MSLAASAAAPSSTASRLRRPLGLVLSGGGSHGAWESGCIESLRAAGVAFDAVLGFSIGSLVGAAYFLGREDILLDRWRNIDAERVLRWGPRLGPHPRYPFSLFSDRPLWESLAYASDDEDAKRRGRCELVVISHRVRDRALEYARFTPGGAAGWDGPLIDKLVGSCAVPIVFPPARARGGELLVDGGVPARDAMRFDALARCRDVLVVQPIRPEELGRVGSWLRNGLDQIGREMCAKHLASGIESLSALPSPPRVLRLMPSKVLAYDQLDFTTRSCAPAVEQGLADGRAFLEELASA